MGTGGVPWEKEDSVIFEAIKRHKGKLTVIAKDPLIGCHYETIKKRVDSNPIMKQMVSNYRNHWVEDTLDQAEDVLKKAMDKIDTDANVALKSAMFFLNNQGCERGYSAPEAKEKSITENLVKLAQQFADGKIKQDDKHS